MLKPFGELLKESRENRHLTLRVLGERVGLSAVYLSELERGTRMPTEETVRKLFKECEAMFRPVDLWLCAACCVQSYGEAWAQFEVLNFEHNGIAGVSFHASHDGNHEAHIDLMGDETIRATATTIQEAARRAVAQLEEHRRLEEMARP